MLAPVQSSAGSSRTDDVSADCVVPALYDRLTRLLKHPDEVDAARKAGLALVGSEPFEDLMERRAAFFRAVALDEESV